MVKQSRVVTGSSSLVPATALVKTKAAEGEVSSSAWRKLGRASGVCTVGLLAALGGMREAKAVGLFTDNTTTTFPNPQTCPGSGTTGFDRDGCYTSWLTINDLDQDGDMDVMFANGGGYYATGNAMESTILFNDGKGVFTNVTPTKFGGALNRLRQTSLADIDGDGDMDIYQPGGFGSDLDKLWVQTATGVYENQAATKLPTALMSRAASSTFGDVDGDGDQDIINMEWFGYTGAYVSRVLFYANDGTGKFTLAEAQNDPQFATATDRFPATISYTGGTPVTATMTNTAPLSATPYWGARAIDVDLADVDGDFDLDLMLMHRNGFSRIFKNDGKGYFTDATNFQWTLNADKNGVIFSTNYPAKRGPYEYNQELCDVDEDGDLDVLVDNSGLKPLGYQQWSPGGGAGSQYVSQLLLNDGTGKFIDDTTNRIFGEPGADDNAVKCADVTGDGHYDLVVASLSGRSEKALINDGTHHFNFVADAIPIASIPGVIDATLGIDAADLNGDKILDLVTGNGESGGTASWVNRVFLGGGANLPDKTAPVFRSIEKPVPKPETPTLIRMSIRDAYTNAAGQMVKDTVGIYKVSGGASKTVKAKFIGGDLFSVLIPAQVVGAEVSLTLSSTDRAGNVGTSAPIVFTIPAVYVPPVPVNPYGGAGGGISGGLAGSSTGGSGGTGGEAVSDAGAGGEEVEVAGGGIGGSKAGAGGGTSTTAGSTGEAGEGPAAGSGGKGRFVTVDDGGCSISDATPASKGRGAALLGFGLGMLGLLRRRRNDKA